MHIFVEPASTTWSDVTLWQLVQEPPRSPLRCCRARDFHASSACFLIPWPQPRVESSSDSCERCYRGSSLAVCIVVFFEVYITYTCRQPVYSKAMGRKLRQKKPRRSKDLRPCSCGCDSHISKSRLKTKSPRVWIINALGQELTFDSLACLQKFAEDIDRCCPVMRAHVCDSLRQHTCGRASATARYVMKCLQKLPCAERAAAAMTIGDCPADATSPMPESTASEGALFLISPTKQTTTS